MSAAFPRQFRLTRPTQFKRVFARPERSSDRCLTVLARANSMGHSRLGLAIAKKHARRALDRNRIKRIVREYFRQHQTRYPPLDLVVLARPGITKRNNAEILESIHRNWNRVTPLCERSSSS